MANGIVTTRDSYQATTKAMEFAFTNASNEVAPLFPKYFNTVGFDPVRSIAQVMPIYELGLMQPRPSEGAAFVSDSPGELIPIEFTFRTWGLQAYVSEEAQTEDPLNFAGMLPKMLANSERYTLDYIMWDIFNYAYNPVAPGSDGLPLCASNHPLGAINADAGPQTQPFNVTGQTFSNSLGNAPFLPETLRQAEILLATLRTDRGNPDYRNGKYLICNPQMAKTIQEVSGAKLAPYTNENQPNTAEGLYELLVVRYINSPTAWFLSCGPGDWRNGGSTHSLLCGFKWRGRSHAWYDNPTGNYAIRSSFRETHGFANWRGLVGGSA
jgi:hypothetical protein